MVVKQEIRKEIPISAPTAYKNLLVSLLAGIEKEGWEMIYKEEEDLKFLV